MVPHAKDNSDRVRVTGSTISREISVGIAGSFSIFFRPPSALIAKGLGPFAYLQADSRPARANHSSQAALIRCFRRPTLHWRLETSRGRPCRLCGLTGRVFLLDASSLHVTVLRHVKGSASGTSKD